MEREELIQRLTVAYPFLEELENISAVCEQCENGFYEYQNRQRKPRRIRNIAIIIGVLLCISVIMQLMGSGAGFADFIQVVPYMVMVGAIVTVISFITNMICKKHGKEMQGFADKYAQYEEHFQKRLEEDGDLIDFIPDQYQSTFAVSYFLDVIRTGAAKDLNEAIQQLLIYSGNLQQQQAMADLAAQAQSMQNQLNAIRDEML